MFCPHVALWVQLKPEKVAQNFLSQICYQGKNTMELLSKVAKPTGFAPHFIFLLRYKAEVMLFSLPIYLPIHICRGKTAGFSTCFSQSLSGLRVAHNSLYPWQLEKKNMFILRRTI